MDYNDMNRHMRDDRVAFDEASHTYFVAGQEYKSVTTVVADCFEKFDAPYWAARKATPEKPAEAWIREWDENARQAREKGTLMHERIERYYLDAPDDDIADGDGAYELFRRFAAVTQLTPYRSEWRIFDEDSKIAGTLDFLAVADDGSLELWDWKRTTKVCDCCGNPLTDNRFGKTGLGAAAALPDTSFYHYALQLSIYRLILETRYGLHPVVSRLGVFHPDNGSPYVVEVPYLQEIAQNILQS